MNLRLVAFNDFHGQLGDSTASVDNTAIGGAATLAGYINKERAENPDGTIVLSAGDAFGASPPESTLLNHESTMAVLAAMGVNLATFGNHEFDRGTGEAMHLIRGGQRYKRVKGKKVPVGSPWPGSPFPWVSANVLDAKTGKPLLPPYVIMEVKGVKVAFIGATTKNLKNVTLASGVRDVKVEDPADAINRYIPELKQQGVKTIVTFMHEGGEKDPSGNITGPIEDIAKRLDPEVDVVVSAHSHKEYVTRIAGKLVTQAGSYAKALTAIDLGVDPKTGQVVASSGRLVRNDEKGVQPDPTVAKMVGMFEQAIAPQTQRVISVLPAPITREKSPAGETPMGTLIAEAQKRFAKTDFALMNPGGIRQDLTAGGPVTWGTLFGVQPFENRVIRAKMTGAQLKKVLEQQFPEGKPPTILQIAGLRVKYDMSKPIGQRIVEITDEYGDKVDMSREYTVAVNNFLKDGGDGFTELKSTKQLADLGTDLQALVSYLKQGNPVPVKPTGRIQVVGEAPHDTH